MAEDGKVAGANATTPHVVGERTTCPRCGREVFQKEMIPVLGEAGPPHHAYVCVECARAMIDRSQVTEPAGVLAASDEPGEATGA